MASVGGDIELMPVSDVALWVAGRSFSGTLTLRRRAVESRFIIRAGLCVQTSSTDPREYLGQHLINFGNIDEDQLQRAFDTQKETKVPLGRVLVMVDAITTAQLQTVLLFKTREGLLDSLCWTDGTWRLTHDIDGDPELDCDRPIDLREAVSEAAARQSMWTEIRRVFPSDATRCDVLIDPATIDSSFDRRLLQHMRAGRSVGEAALELRAMDFQVYARLYDLASRQLVRPLLTSTFHQVRSPTPLAQPAATTSTPHMIGAIFPAPTAKAPVLTALATFPAPTQTAGPAFSSGFSVARPPAPQHADDDDDDDISVSIEEDIDFAPAAPVPALTSPAQAAQAAPAKGWAPPAPAAAATDDDDGGSFGTYMMVRPERVIEAPGVKIPPEAEDPAQALRLALAGRNWAEALLLSQRILEHDPIDSEAIAAQRVAEVQLRRIEQQGGGGTEADFDRVPSLAMARDEVALAHLTSKERYVLSRVDGRRSLAQIAAVSPIQKAELLRIADSFVQRGVLTY